MSLLVGRQPLKLAKDEYRFPGEPIPEAAAYRNLDTLLRNGDVVSTDGAKHERDDEIVARMADATGVDLSVIDPLPGDSFRTRCLAVIVDAASQLERNTMGVVRNLDRVEQHQPDVDNLPWDRDPDDEPVDLSEHSDAAAAILRGVIGQYGSLGDTKKQDLVDITRVMVDDLPSTPHIDGLSSKATVQERRQAIDADLDLYLGVVQREEIEQPATDED